MYTISYWNGGAAEWRGTASGTFYDISAARSRMRALSEQCDYCVRFRIEDLTATAL